MPRVRIFSWNPRRSSLPPRIAHRVPVGRRVNNFGDLLGPLIVDRMLSHHGVKPERGLRDCTLLSVGSVLHFARDGDVIWGTGVNGKMPLTEYRFTQLDVRAVRGPLTRRFLKERGITAPEVYGDPALLLPGLTPELLRPNPGVEYAVTVVPNLNDAAAYPADKRTLNPQAPLEDCLRRIAASRFVTGSSLHGIIVAESLGIPARLIASGAEHPFKYEDYYLGTGRAGVEPASSVDEAIAMGGQPPAQFDPEPLHAAFPLDLWLR